MAEFHCPECGYQKTVSDELTGRSAKCKKCGCSVPITRTIPAVETSSSQVTSIKVETDPESNVGHRRETTNFFVGLFDFRLERYLTPVICRITWLVCLAGFAFWLVLTLIQPLVEKTGTTSPTNAPTTLDGLSLDGLSLVDLLSPKPTSGIDSLKWFVVKIVAAVMSVLWTRVLLESVVVYFNILKSLRSIEQNTKQTP